MYLKSVLRYKITLLSILLFSCLKGSFSQCGTKINTYPFSEGFESSDGGWTVGGSNNDWIWGTPAKPVISSAGSGSKCWMVGGLTGNSYANGESSWLQSPCFDLSSLQFPYLSFKVFWESEKKYDGASLQYSTDGGTQWKDLGSTSSSAISCLNSNWYNNNSVKFLSGLNITTNGWSGNIQTTNGSCQGGDGSNGWVVAKHSLIDLKGSSGVVFRFVFGAGTTCNNFDGFAIDDFTITEAPKNKASFSYQCGQNNFINFTNTSASCPTDFDWAFDDLASGQSNTSKLQNPSHQFVGSGKHSVSLIVSSPYNQPDTFTTIITTLGVSTTISSPIKCYGDSNGEIKAVVVGTNETILYSWNTNPVQNNSTATNLSQGTYAVICSSASNCPVTDSVTLISPSKILDSVTINQPGCIYASGEAQIITSGGTIPYSYNWSPNVSIQSTATGLAVGRYTVLVSDKNNCSDLVIFDVAKIFPPTVSLSNVKNTTCTGDEDGLATIVITNGLSPYTISWNTAPIQRSMTATGLKAGNYVATTEDQNRCRVLTNVTISEPPPISNSATVTNATCGLGNGKVSLAAVGNYQYQWSPLIGTGALADNVFPGIYSVIINDPSGCTQQINNIWVKNIGNPARPFLGNDTSICTGEELVLSPGIFENYIWQDNTTNNTITINQSGKYWVNVTNNSGCKGFDSINVIVLDGCIDLYFPSSFSPNNDGLNETFGPTGNFNAVSNYELLIFNRWGNLVFKTKNPRERWNGKLNGQLNSFSNYVWYSSYQFKGQGRKFKKGSLIIIN